MERMPKVTWTKKVNVSAGENAHVAQLKGVDSAGRHYFYNAQLEKNGKAFNLQYKVFVDGQNFQLPPIVGTDAFNGNLTDARKYVNGIFKKIWADSHS